MRARSETRRVRRASALLVIVAVLGLAGSRAPFFAHGPDWSILSWEHCFLLSFPLIHENRLQLEPDEPLPYWVIDQGNMRGHYHAGMGWIARVVGALSSAFDSRGLWLVRLVGTVLAAAFVGLFAWALGRLWRDGRDRAQVLVPLFLCLFPPTLFLWASLTPEGHYYDSHFFYGLFLPAYVAICRERLSVPMAVFTGLLAGFAIVYTFSNAVFLVALVVASLLFSRTSILVRLRDLGFAVAAALLVFFVLGQPRSIFARLTTSNDAADPVAGDRLPFFEWLGSGHASNAAADHLACFLGFHGSGIFDGRTDPVGAGVVLALFALVVAGSAILLWECAVAFVPAVRRKMDAQRRFLALNGLLLAGFVAAYLLFDPYMMPDDVYLNISYLLPAIPMLFVGIGALFHRLLRTQRGVVRWSGRIALLLAGTIMIAGWANAWRTYADPLLRPDFQRCDSMHIEGYYWDPPPVVHAGWLQRLRSTAGAVVSPVAGERRCERFHGQDGGTCSYLRYVMDAMYSAAPVDCRHEPPSRRATCVRAQGAARHGWTTCGDPLAPAPGRCTDVDPADRAACLSGAFQGTSIDWSVAHCIESFALLCEAQFAEGRQRASCMEQIAALVEGAPMLPGPPAEPPPGHEHWPVAWHGLLDRALQLASADPGGSTGPSCEDVYLAEYADELPPTAGLAFDMCLTLARTQYPWCAIGVARQRGLTECTWAGGLASYNGSH